MAESVDALVSNTSGAIRAGSTPALGTTKNLQMIYNQSFEDFILCLVSAICPHFYINGTNGIYENHLLSW